jgi:hypothetical protein
MGNGVAGVTAVAFSVGVGKRTGGALFGPEAISGGEDGIVGRDTSFTSIEQETSKNVMTSTNRNKRSMLFFIWQPMCECN